MARLFSTWFATWIRLVILAYVSSPIPPRVLSATMMQTSQGCGTRHLHLWTPVLPSPISWASKLQSQVAIYIIKAEYIAMSQALHEDIPIMGLLQEMREQDFKVLCTEPYVYWKVFEDKSGALKLAGLPMLCPKTKHINVCYHHFCKHVCKGLIKIFPIDIKDQIADALTKHLAQNDFQRHHCLMCGSDLHDLPKWWSITLLVLRYLCYRYLNVSPGTAQKSTAWKCNILSSIKIHVLEIQQALLSMDMSVERFLEIGASDLFVLTQRLQDPLYIVWAEPKTIATSNILYLWKLIKYYFTLEPLHFYYTNRKPLIRAFQRYLGWHLGLKLDPKPAFLPSWPCYR